MATVNIALGANIQTTISGNAAGTTYQFAAGIYYGQSFLPQTGDTYIGSPYGGTIISGACKLTTFTGTGPYKATSGTTDIQGTTTLAALATALGTYGAVGTVSFSGTAMTVHTTTAGAWAVGQNLYATGVPQGTYIVSGSGTAWVVSANVGTIATETVQATNDTNNNGTGNNFLNPLAGYEPDLFVDNVLQTRVAKGTTPAAGQWYWDNADSSVNMGTNPSGHTVELSLNFNLGYDNGASGVNYRNITFEKYSNKTSSGVIHGQRASFVGCTFQHNHGGGLVGSPNANDHARNCRFLYNGQTGIYPGGLDYTVENCELAYNNQAGVNPGFEAGGMKGAGTDGCKVIGCHSHDNFGPGIWFDLDSTNTTIDGNLVENNVRYGTSIQSYGIIYEISHGQTKIINNRVRNNDGCGIYISNSSNTEVAYNLVMVRSTNAHTDVVPSGGIVVLNTTRSDDPSATAINNNVHDNVIIHPGDSTYDGFSCSAAITNLNLTWTNNTYVLPDMTGTHWTFDAVNGGTPNTPLTWSQAQTAGYETGTSSARSIGGASPAWPTRVPA